MPLKNGIHLSHHKATKGTKNHKVFSYLVIARNEMTKQSKKNIATKAYILPPLPLWERVGVRGKSH
jgi:hypothetical protein